MFNLFNNLSPSGQNLKQHIAEGALLVDVRSPGEFAGGSAKGAINIPLDNLMQHLDKFRGHRHIIVFCRSGNRSAMAKQILEGQGFKNVINGGTWENVAIQVS